MEGTMAVNTTLPPTTTMLLYDNNTLEHNSSTTMATGDQEEFDNFVFILYSVVVPLLFGTISIVGMVGNILVIYVIFSRTRMRTVTNLLLLNLAFADLSFVVVIPSFTAYEFATHQWPFGDSACKLMHYLVNVTAYVTVYTLVLISAIRYMTIVHHVATMRIRTKQNVIVMIIAIWILMLLLNIPVALSYGSSELKPNQYDCDIYSKGHGQRLFTTFFVFGYVLPLLVIAVFSMCILHHIQRQKVTMIEKNKRNRSSTKKRQASRLIVLVVVIFAILWLPIHIHLLIAFYGQLPHTKAYMAISLVWNCAAYANSCVNPFIYNHASREFRQAFREVICCLPMGRRGSKRSSMSTITTKLAASPTEPNGGAVNEGNHHLLEPEQEKMEQEANDL